MMKLFKKKKADRSVFGFLCDEVLASRVRDLAEIMEVPIYTFAEHLLQLGLAHIAFEIRGDPDSVLPVTEEVKDHLTSCHLLVKRLGEEQYEQDLIARHAELTTEQKEQVMAVIDLARRLSESGIPHQTVIGVIETLAARIHERQREGEKYTRQKTLHSPLIPQRSRRPRYHKP